MRAEQEGAALYQMLAKTERDPHLAELYRRMAEAEQRHAAVWKDYLHSAGEPVPTYAPGWRVCTLAWRIAGYYGVDRYLLPLLGTPWTGSLVRKKTVEAGSATS